MKKYYGEDKVISRYRLGTAIDELNELLNKSKKVLYEDKYNSNWGYIVRDFIFEIEEIQKEYDLI